MQVMELKDSYKLKIQIYIIFHLASGVCARASDQSPRAMALAPTEDYFLSQKRAQDLCQT